MVARPKQYTDAFNTLAARFREGVPDSPAGIAEAALRALKMPVHASEVEVVEIAGSCSSRLVVLADHEQDVRDFLQPFIDHGHLVFWPKKSIVKVFKHEDLRRRCGRLPREHTRYILAFGCQWPALDTFALMRQQLGILPLFTGEEVLDHMGRRP